MELAHLQSFLAVYRAGTVTAAAATLRLSQPAVSAHVQALEERLGRPLFVRRARGVTPTEVAHALAAEVAAPLDALSAVTGEGGFSPEAGPLTGTCVLGGPADVLAAVVLPALAPLVRQGLRLRVVPQHGPGLVRDLTSGRLDVAVLGRPSRARGVELHALLDEELRLVAAPPIAARLDPGQVREDLPGALAAVPLVAFDDGAPLVRRYLRYLFPQAPLPVPAVVVPDLRAVLALVTAGAGWSVLPGYLTAPALDRGDVRLVHRPDETPINTLYTAVRSGRGSQAPVAAVLHRLHAAVRRTRP